MHYQSGRDFFSKGLDIKLSKKCDYALRALITLVDNHAQGTPISVREIAQRNDVPKRFLEHILLDLKEMGWAKSLPGRAGGYVLGVAPGEIKLEAVIRHFDGMLAPAGCVSVHDYQKCSQEPTCRFKHY